MRLSLISTVLAGSGLVAAGPLPKGSEGFDLGHDLKAVIEEIGQHFGGKNPTAPRLPVDAFKPNPFVKPLTLEEAKIAPMNTSSEAAPEIQMSTLAAAATCSNPAWRWEWDQFSTNDRKAFVSAVKCLMGKKPSGRFSPSKSLYEDMVRLHQMYTPNVHGNAKFLIWHRYYLWTFEQLLRTDCGYTAPMPWFDETRYAGKFSQSSIFTNDYFGSINIHGACVTDGQFAGLTLNIGPGSGSQAHCLSRNGDGSKTANTNSAMVDACNNRNDYADMAACSEGGAHAWGHNGIGAVMSDVYASPGDPVFWLHHAFIDRNFRIWQNKNSARLTSIDGNDAFGNRLTMDTWVNVNGIRPDVQIKDILNTLGDKLCYRYNY